MQSLGLDLSKSAIDAIGEGFGTALPYVLLVVLLGGLYFVQQRMVAARAAISPTMSQAQQKLMQYLPVFFAVFQVFFLAALVVYYIFQTVLRIAQQIYITKVFYGHDEALGRQAQRAGAGRPRRGREVRRVDRHVRPGQARPSADPRATRTASGRRARVDRQESTKTTAKRRRASAAPDRQVVRASG